jgi:hypothetical protein
MRLSLELKSVLLESGVVCQLFSLSVVHALQKIIELTKLSDDGKRRFCDY